MTPVRSARTVCPPPRRRHRCRRPARRCPPAPAFGAPLRRRGAHQRRGQPGCSRLREPPEPARRQAGLRGPRRRPGPQPAEAEDRRTPRSCAPSCSPARGRCRSSLDSAFPSTTAASLASFGTGLAAGQHGMVGYDVLDPDQDRVVNMLGSWDAGVDPQQWQPFPTVFERAADHVDVTTVSLPQFSDSAMTQAALRGGRYRHRPPPRTPGPPPPPRRWPAPDRSLMYFYVNELDKAGHRHGCQSPQWEHQLEELDATVKRLSATLPAGTTVLLTADHGMLDVPESQRIDYSADPALVAGVRHTAGEPRMVHLYLEEPERRRRPRPAAGRLAGPFRRPDLGLHPGGGHRRRALRRGPGRGRPADRRRDDRCPGRPGASTTPAASGPQPWRSWASTVR